jgi:hypothetical protein
MPILERINDQWHATLRGKSIPLIDQDRDFEKFTDGQIKAYLIDMKTRLKAHDPEHKSVDIIESWYR